MHEIPFYGAYGIVVHVTALQVLALKLSTLAISSIHLHLLYYIITTPFQNGCEIIFVCVRFYKKKSTLLWAFEFMDFYFLCTCTLILLYIFQLTLKLVVQRKHEIYKNQCSRKYNNLIIIISKTFCKPRKILTYWKSLEECAWVEMPVMTSECWNRTRLT